MTSVDTEGNASGNGADEAVVEGQGGQLKRGAVGLTGLLAQSAAAPAPEFSAVVTGGVIAIYMGGSAPFVVLVGAVIWLFFTRILYKYSKELADAGGLYTLMRAGIGKRPAIVGAWSYLLGVVIFVPGLSILAGYLFQSALAHIFPKNSAFTGSWVPWALGFLLVAIILAYTGVRISVRAILALTVIGMVSMTVLAVVILAKGGKHGIAWESLEPWKIPPTVGLSAIAISIGLAVNLFVGTETAVFLAEEVHAPKRLVPKAVVGAVAALTVFYILLSLGITTGYGFNEAGKAWSTASGTAVADLANTYMFQAYGDFLLIVLAVSGLSSSIGVLNSSARLILAWGRIGILPTAAARVHRRHQTPHIAIVAILVFSLLSIGAGVIWQGSGAAAATTVYAWVLIVGTILLLIAFLFVGVAAIVKSLRARSSIFDTWFAPGIALIGFGLALYGNLYPWPSAPFNTAPVAGLLLIAIGVVFAVVRGRRSKSDDQSNSDSGN
jgi:amino acid transporter